MCKLGKNTTSSRANLSSSYENGRTHHVPYFGRFAKEPAACLTRLFRTGGDKTRGVTAMTAEGLPERVHLSCLLRQPRPVSCLATQRLVSPPPACADQPAPLARQFPTMRTQTNHRRKPGALTDVVKVHLSQLSCDGRTKRFSSPSLVGKQVASGTHSCFVHHQFTLYRAPCQGQAGGKKASGVHPGAMAGGRADLHPYSVWSVSREPDLCSPVTYPRHRLVTGSSQR
ncbi:hypothetical protein Bbelb_356900 [Branchiostoma belcheri]|nr:hypothetical protein Bbelb_356900 [Branchiostoma belcheri]